ncbi:hypothetical protein U1Q18_028245 [Sarracenia purpurea var. burkii]
MEEYAESSSLNCFGSPVNITGISMVSLPESLTRRHRSPTAVVDTRSGSYETIAADEICKDAGRVVAHGVTGELEDGSRFSIHLFVS